MTCKKVKQIHSLQRLDFLTNLLVAAENFTETIDLDESKIIGILSYSGYCSLVRSNFIFENLNC